MSYPPSHSKKTRAKIVDSARRLFNRKGFDNVSIQQIMAGAGLTHGGFYSHFKSKSDLYTEVLGCFFTDPNWKNYWEGVEVDLKSSDAAAQVVRAYLSRQHFEDKENSCPMVALPTDVSRSGKNAKRAFQTVFKAMVSILESGSKEQCANEQCTKENVQPLHATAQAVAALCVGGMVVARAIADRAMADELRDSCMAVALQIGGWGKETEIESKSEKISA
ncbi:MAG TPA: TetR/AcrR family transcriptional regulator [Terriglobales bacterium]